jgi:glycosyltransferase involved in cell wall biosynthesis
MNISVIIPTYNRADFILKAVKSVQSQSLHVKQIIVVDDGSTDNTKELLKDENITYIYQKNNGVSSARNHGIKEAKHEWLAFLDSDDTWHKNKIKEHVSLHVNSPEIKASFTDELWIRNGKVINKKKHLKKDEPTFLNSLRTCKIGASTFFAHKSVFDEIGLFDETLKVCEDYDLWLRILTKYKIKLIDKELITKQAGHENQLSFTTPLIDSYRVKALEKHSKSVYKKEVLEEIEYKNSILRDGAKKRV